MGYPNDLYAQASKNIYERKIKAEDSAKERLEKLAAVYPRLNEIKWELQSTGAQIVKAVMFNKNNVEEVITKLKEKNTALQIERKEILVKNNFPENYLDVNYSCSECNDEGYINGKMCKCFENELKKLMFSKLNQGSNLSLCSFETFNLKYYSDKEENGISPRKKMQNVFDFCLKYARTFNENSENLLLFGKTGLGKTHLSLSIANEVINKGYGVIYDSMPNLMDKIEREKFSNEDAETLKAVLDCDLLILDDLGAEFSTQFVVSSVYNIINSRINLGKATIISTNLDFKELETKYSERLVSRLLGEYTSLRFLGSDIRILKKAEKRENVE